MMTSENDGVVTPASVQVCTKCGAAVRLGAKFCKSCGVAATASSPVLPPSASATPNSNEGNGAQLAESGSAFPVAPGLPTAPRSGGLDSKVILIGIAAVVAVLVGVYYYFATSPMREFNEYLDRRVLVSANGLSAYSVYQRAITEKGAGSSVVESMNDKALPLLQSASKAAFDSWYRESELSKPPERRAPGEGGISNWDEMLQLQDWLVAIDRNSTVNAQHAYARGMIALNRRNWIGAREQFEEALRHHPNWPLALNGVGKASFGTRQYDLTEKFYLAASNADRSWHFPHFNLGTLYRDVLRNFDASEREYRNAIQLDPGRPSFHLNLGLLYYMYGKQYWPAACLEFNAALNSPPERILSPADRDLAVSRRNRACHVP